MTALDALVHDRKTAEVDQSLSEVLAELERMLHGTALLELTPRALDAISGIGERLSTPLVAGALRELGVRAGRLRDGGDRHRPHHGRAEPLMGPTRERAEAACARCSNEGVVPVVTGFIGATRQASRPRLAAAAPTIPRRSWARRWARRRPSSGPTWTA